MFLISKKVVKETISSLFWVAALKFSPLIKCSFVVGSWYAFFGITSVLSPLVGAFSSFSGSCLVFATLFLCKFLITGSFGWHMLAFYVPGFCASLYWSKPNALTRAVLPLACMALFLAHPVGFAAAPYSFFWLIPVVFYAAGFQSIFCQALASTFIAHAVGSAIWMYTTPMTSAVWLSLIPVVICERLLFAVGITGLHSVILWSKNQIKNAYGSPCFAQHRV